MTALLLPFVLGAAFGALLHRVGASSRDAIRAMLRLSDLTILKFMLLAIGVAAVGVATLTALGAGHLAVKPLVVWGVVLGGLVFGVGFGLSGYCPGTSLVACVEGKRDAWATVAGAFLGALAYSLLWPFFKAHLLAEADFGRVTLAQALHFSPVWLGLALGVGLIVLALRLPQRPSRFRADAVRPLG